MRAALQILTVLAALVCAGSVFAATATSSNMAAAAATTSSSSSRIGKGWVSEQACVAAHGGRPWCRMQNCAQNSTGPCIGQPKRTAWFYEPPRKD